MHTVSLKFSVQMPMFNVTRFILATLENCGPYVERIYLTRSELPWRYNIAFRDIVRNPTPASIIDASPWRDKITLIESEWATEEEQRNESLRRARADGMDFMIIQDADEYYLDSEYQQALAYIAAHPDYDFYKVKSYVFWKSTKYIIKNRYGQPYDEDLKPFAINCRSEVGFAHLRGIDETKWRICPELLNAECYHLSWVMSDEELLTKLSVWGHTNDFDWLTWYRDMEERNAAWAKFQTHPEWARLRALPEYAHTATNNTARFLAPMPYSQY